MLHRTGLLNVVCHAAEKTNETDLSKLRAGRGCPTVSVALPLAELPAGSAPLRALPLPVLQRALRGSVPILSAL